MRAARALSDAFQAHNGFLITACRLKRGPGPAHMARLANHRRQAFLESLGGTVVTITTAPVCGFVCLDWRAVGSEVEAFFSYGFFILFSNLQFIILFGPWGDLPLLLIRARLLRCRFSSVEQSRHPSHLDSNDSLFLLPQGRWSPLQHVHSRTHSRAPHSYSTENRNKGWFFC